jgi:molybdopterin-guanine dinucleotide biosynthesis protein A
MVTAYVLAGGYSTRFGRDKALTELNGKPMLLEMCELIYDVATRGVFVVGAANKYGQFGFECVEDRWPGEGPLGGIVTALIETQRRNPSCRWNLIVGCDMPFLTEEILVYCVDRAKQSKADVVLPRSAHGLEPLCACYRTDAGPALQAVFERGVRKVTEALKQVRTEVLDEADWKRFYNAGRLFWNMNTPADYEEARRILEAEKR